MGITFRSGDYIRFVFFGGRTIKDGEAAAIWNVNGVHKQIIGPKRKWMYKSTIRFLTRHKAESHQYIKVAHRNGNVQYIYGPSELYENPALHDRVTVHDGIKLERSTDCIIVYEKPGNQCMNGDAKSQDCKFVPTAVPATNTTQKLSNKENLIQHTHEIKTQKRLIFGPSFFMPSENEFVHTFSWTTYSSDTPAKNVFQLLHTDKNRVWSVTVPITTTDSANFSAHLFIKYHMDSIDECISSEDPIAKMYCGLKSDLHLFGNTISSVQLRQQGEQNEVIMGLVNLETYTSLKDAAISCGFSIDSIKVERLTFSRELQKQASSEQNLAAALRAQMAEKTQRRQLHEIELEDRRKRIDQEAELKRIQVEIDAKLEEESYSLREAELERRLTLQKREVSAEKDMEGIANKNVIVFLKELKEEGVDLTKFLCTPTGMDVVSPSLDKAPALKWQRKQQRISSKLDE